MRTYIYVDGFNLYYGALKGTAWKWLDLLVILPHWIGPSLGLRMRRIRDGKEALQAGGDRQSAAAS